jgi:hypothetical protein
MSGPAAFGPHVYVAATPVQGRLVVVLRGVTERRGLRLEAHRSRATPRHEIHELMVTDEASETGTVVDRVGLIGFFEAEQGGVILVGSSVYLGETLLGTVVGFDETHMPNHINICVRVDTLTDGERLGLQPGDGVRFVKE